MSLLIDKISFSLIKVVDLLFVLNCIIKFGIEDTDNKFILSSKMQYTFLNNKVFLVSLNLNNKLPFLFMVILLALL